MPELPEVENVARYLSSFVGKKVVSYCLRREKNFVEGKELLPSLIGNTLERVSRRGKFLLFSFTSFTFLAHLRMEGRFVVNDSSSVLPYELFSLTFPSFVFHYTDTRKFGTLALLPKGKEENYPPLLSLGKEPSEITPEELHQKVSSSSLPIKSLLMDQSIISGIGNIYADEICFAAKVSPKAKGKEISLSTCESILEEARRILDLAIVNGGSHIRTFVSGGTPAGMQDLLEVYGKQGKPCPRCGTPLTYQKISGRGTTYCPICQRSSSIVIGITGPIHSGKSTASSILKELGFSVFNADEEVKKLYKKSSVRQAMKKILGKESVLRSSLNLSYLRKVLSTNPKKKKEWEGYLDPLLLQEAKKFISTHPRVILDVPLLPRSSLVELVDVVILIRAESKHQRERLLVAGKDADAMMELNKDYPYQKAEKIATFVINNNGNIDELRTTLLSLPLFTGEDQTRDIDLGFARG
ncbi:MAG: DNA-formamidopyrimidine glycosylase [Candidatus Enteromonas sp.]|nr:DNA-formamidopyrimidine glycosylase [Candidatus Enteromonas sp.]